MKIANFENLSQEMIQHVYKILFNKRAEYVGQNDDCLRNLKQPVSLMDSNPAEVCMWYDTKHFASMVKIAQEANRGVLPSLELLQEKVGDYLSYGLLYYACMVEMMAAQEVEKRSTKTATEVNPGVIPKPTSEPQPIIDRERQAEFPLPMPGDLPPALSEQESDGRNSKHFGFWNKK